MKTRIVYIDGWYYPQRRRGMLWQMFGGNSAKPIRFQFNHEAENYLEARLGKAWGRVISEQTWV